MLLERRGGEGKRGGHEPKAWWGQGGDGYVQLLVGRLGLR